MPAIHDGSGGDANAITGRRIRTRTTATRVDFTRLVEGDDLVSGVLLARGREPVRIPSLPMAERPSETFANVRLARPPPSRKNNPDSRHSSTERRRGYVGSPMVMQRLSHRPRRFRVNPEPSFGQVFALVSVGR